MAESVKDYFKKYTVDVYTDILGNIIAHNPGNCKRLMIIAHHDVVCLMVTYIDANGFLYVKPAGGIDSSILPARKVIINHDGKSITGIIGKKPIHLIREEQNVKVSYDSLWIDIGAKNQEEAKETVGIGDYVYFCSEREKLTNNLITGSYFDDQIGMDVMLELAKRFHGVEIPWEVYFVASNYEEIGTRGALVAANSIKPDVCICIDATHATDYPTMNIINDGDIKIGEGCVLAKGPNIFPELFEELKSIAERNGIKYQVEASPYQTGTDANVIQLSRDGVKTAVVSIPCRYMHTPHEVCSKDDVESAIELLTEFIKLEPLKNKT